MSRTKNNILVFITLLILTLAGFLFTYLKQVNHFSSEKDSSEILTVILFGNDSPEDFNILEQRLQKGIGRSHYSLKKKEHGIELLLDKEVLKNQKPDQFLEFFLTEPVQYSLNVSNPSYEHFSALHTLVIPGEKDFLDIKIKKNTDSSEKEYIRSSSEVPVLTFSESDDYRLIIRFSNAVDKQISQIPDSAGKPGFCNNFYYDGYETNNYYQEGWLLTPDETEPATYYLNYGKNDILFGNEDLFIYDLKHKKLSKPYNYSIIDNLRWEEECIGKNQHPVNDISSPYYTFCCSPVDTTLELYDEISTSLIHRLDALDSPYAIGKSDDGKLYVKIVPDHINVSVMDSLVLCSTGYYDCGFRLGKQEMNYLTSSSSSAVFTRKDSSIKIHLGEEDEEILQDMIQKYHPTSSNTEDSKLWFTIHSIPVAWTTVSRNTSINELTFNHFYIDNDSENEWFTQLLSEVLNNAKHEPGYYIKNYSLNDRSYNNPEQFGIEEADTYYHPELESALKAVCPAATVNRKTANKDTLNIELHLNPDENLVPKIFDLTPKLLDAIDFKECGYSFVIAQFRCIDTPSSIDQVKRRIKKHPALIPGKRHLVFIAQPA